MSALAGILLFSAFYLPILLAACVIAAVLIGAQEREGSQAFMTGLVLGWVGFTIGAVAAFVAITFLEVLSRFNPSEILPAVLVSSIPLITIGGPVGFLLGFFSALAASMHSWFLDRRSRARRLARSPTENDEPVDPFGSRKHVERK